MLKNLIKIGQYLWVNPTVHLDINKNSLPEEILEQLRNLSPKFRDKLQSSIEKDGMYFPFLGKTSDKIWFGKHRWEVLTKNRYNKWFLFIVADDITSNLFYFPVIDYEENSFYKVSFIKKQLSLHSNSQISKTKAFVHYSDFMGHHHRWFEDSPPLDFIENMSNFHKFLKQEDQWAWLSEIKEII